MDVDLEAIILHKGNNRCSVHVSRVNNDQTSGGILMVKFGQTSQIKCVLCILLFISYKYIRFTSS